MLKVCVIVTGALLLIGIGTRADAVDGRSGSWHSATQGAPSLKVCKKLVAQNPQSAIANNDLGWAYRQNGDAAQAEKYLKAAVQLDPKLAQAHSNLSVVLLDRGAFQDAQAEAHQAIALDVSNPIYREVLGNALMKADDRKAAIEQYRQAVKLKPDYENALYNLGNALAEDGQVQEAKFTLSTALKLDSKDDRVVSLLDQLLAKEAK